MSDNGGGAQDAPALLQLLLRLLELLSARHLTAVTLVGWSMGCTVSLTHMRSGAPRVGRLVLVVLVAASMACLYAVVTLAIYFPIRHILKMEPAERVGKLRSSKRPAKSNPIFTWLLTLPSILLRKSYWLYFVALLL